jgi:hypothetical protein
MSSHFARAALFVVVVGSTACGPSSYSSSLELTLEGSFNGAGGVQTLDVSGDVWELPEPDSQCLSCGRAVMPDSTEWILPGFLARGSDPSVDVTFRFQVGEATVAGARLFMGLTVDNAGPPTDLPATLDRVRFTGDPAEPYQATVIVDTTLEGQDPPLVAKGQAEMFWNCEYDIPGVEVGELCFPTSDSLEVQLERKLGEPGFTPSGRWGPLSNTCDEAVLAPFWSLGSVLFVDAANKTYGFVDKEPITCVQTPLGSTACGATATVEVGGCTWTVDAIEEKATETLALRAKASDCGLEVPYCSALLTPCEFTIADGCQP